MAGKAPAG